MKKERQKKKKFQQNNFMDFLRPDSSALPSFTAAYAVQDDGEHWFTELKFGDAFVAFFKAPLHDILFVIVRSAKHDVTIFGRKSDN